LVSVPLLPSHRVLLSAVCAGGGGVMVLSPLSKRGRRDDSRPVGWQMASSRGWNDAGRWSPSGDEDVGYWNESDWRWRKLEGLEICGRRDDRDLEYHRVLPEALS